MLEAEMQHRATSTIFTSEVKAEETKTAYTLHTVQRIQRFQPTTEQNMKQLRSLLESGFGHLTDFSNLDWDNWEDWESHSKTFTVKTPINQPTLPPEVINASDIDMAQERERLQMMLDVAQKQADTFTDAFLKYFKEHGAGAFTFAWGALFDTKV
jgi:hypothetical protein